jgi:hypothetical protein
LFVLLDFLEEEDFGVCFEAAAAVLMLVLDVEDTAVALIRVLFTGMAPAAAAAVVVDDDDDKARDPPPRVLRVLVSIKDWACA